MHMPGHKGVGDMGIESLDITEIEGADSLYEASGIIAESEAIASDIFGSPTYFSTEGSSQCVRAMVYMLSAFARISGKPRRIAAGRNAHKSLLYAIAMLDMDVDWLYGDEADYLSCDLSAEAVDRYLSEHDVCAVFLTSPDYLGGVADVRGIAEVCHRHGILLAVDQAHGAYLRFCTPSAHSIDLGADMCCASAHKTLPALTGCAYLHLATTLPMDVAGMAKEALAVFGSTSPSYILLQSLDSLNGILRGDFALRLSGTISSLEHIRRALRAQGYELLGAEPLKLTIRTTSVGYSGDDFAEILYSHGIVVEYHDRDHLVMMPSVATTTEELEKLSDVLLAIPRKTPIERPALPVFMPRAVKSIREAMLSPHETIPVSEALGRVASAPNVGCPPAVAIVVCGELIDRAAIQRLTAYGYQNISVCK